MRLKIEKTLQLCEAIWDGNWILVWTGHITDTSIISAELSNPVFLKSKMKLSDSLSPREPANSLGDHRLKFNLPRRSFTVISPHSSWRGAGWDRYTNIPREKIMVLPASRRFQVNLLSRFSCESPKSYRNINAYINQGAESETTGPVIAAESRTICIDVQLFEISSFWAMVLIEVSIISISARLGAPPFAIIVTVIFNDVMGLHDD